MYDLVNDVINGDMKAFEELYIRTSKKIYFICYGFVKNEQDAMDLMQDTYLSALTHLTSLKNPERFTQWISQIAVNKCKDYLMKHTPLLLEEEVMNNIPVEDDDFTLPEKYIMDKEKRKILMDIMTEKLSVLQYQTVVLYYFNGLSQQEIAACMDCPEGTVSYRLSVAREKIKSGVLAYEKKSGVKLYCIAGIPFLTAFFAAETESLVVPNVFAAIMSRVATGSEAAGAVIAEEVVKNATSTVAAKAVADTAANTVMKAGVTAFFHSVSFKIAAIVTGLIIFGGVGVWASSLSNDEKSSEVKTENVSETEKKNDFANETEKDFENETEKLSESKAGDVYENDRIAIKYVSSSYIPGIGVPNGSIQLVLDIENKTDVTLKETDVFYCANGLSNTGGWIRRIEPGRQEVTLELSLYQLKDDGPVEISSVDMILAFYKEGSSSIYSEKACFTVRFSQPITFDAVPYYSYDKCQLVYSDKYLSYYDTLTYKEGETTEFSYVESNMNEFVNFIYSEESGTRFATCFLFPGSYTPVRPGGIDYLGSPDKLECNGKFEIVDFLNGLSYYGAHMDNTAVFRYVITKVEE